LKGKTAGIISAIIVVVIILSGFIPYIVALHVVTTPYPTQETSTFTNYATQVQTVPSTTTSIAVITQQSVTTISLQVYGLSAYTINCSKWVYETANLQAGEDVQVTFNAGDTVDVYIMTSTQYSSYTGGTTSNSVASLEGQSSGTFGYNVPVGGTYYLVVWNPHTGLFCIGGEKVTVNSLTGTATLQQTVNYEITSTNTGVVYVTSTQTLTLSSYSKYTTTLTSTSTKTCTQGWLQAIFGCS
jgi:hypothetical protein